MDDDKGMNELLDKYRLAAGASVFVSNGHLVIPYEDGTEDNTAQKLTALKEERLALQEKLGKVKRSLQISLTKNNKAVAQYNEAVTDEKTAADTLRQSKDYNSKDKAKLQQDKGAAKNEQKRLENVIKQGEQVMLNQRAQLTDFEIELEVIDKEIEELSK